MINIILLAGGESQRLWPFSGGHEAKQFLPLFAGESMLQRTYRQVKRLPFVKEVLVSTGSDQEAVVKAQLPAALTLCEPQHKGTYAAILLATAFLREERGASAEEIVGVVPIDGEVGEDYFTALEAMGALVNTAPESIVLMGLKPREATVRFGYILPAGNGRVEHFVEKPSLEVANALIARGAYWNGGISLFKAALFGGQNSYRELLANYAQIEPRNFDQVILESGRFPLLVHPYNGEWDDLGTWESLLKAIGAVNFGPYRVKGEAHNTTVLNLTGKLLKLTEPTNLLVAAGSRGTLVVNKGDLSSLPCAF
ncbi:MAG: sugar phosphate nucleotidyltransferase [Sphaerochaetaceae bacterium]